jgi:hypothetical protein
LISKIAGDLKGGKREYKTLLYLEYKCKDAIILSDDKGEALYQLIKGIEVFEFQANVNTVHIEESITPCTKDRYSQFDIDMAFGII